MKKRITALFVILILAAAFVSAGCGEKKEAAQQSVSAAADTSSAAVRESTDKSAEIKPGEASQQASAQSTEETSQQSSAESSAVSSESKETENSGPGEDALTVSEDGEYTDKEHVALYIHEFGHLPSNYVTKNEAMDAGWNNREGNLNSVLPGKSIGGDRFGNYEGLLPKANGRKYYECDIDFNPEGITSEPVYRGEKRIIYSNDGLVFYTEDHYESFEQLY